MNNFNNNNPNFVPGFGYNNMGYAMNPMANQQILPEEKSSLTPEEQQLLRDQSDKVKLEITDFDMAKAKCNHQGHFLQSLGNGMFKCSMCGDIIHMRDWTEEEIQEVLANYKSILDNIKYTDRFLPVNVSAPLYTSLAMTNKIPEIYKLVVGEFKKLATPGQLGNAHMFAPNDAVRAFGNIMSPGQGYAVPQQPYAQPGYNPQGGFVQAGYQPQPQPQMNPMGFQNQGFVQTAPQAPMMQNNGFPQVVGNNVAPMQHMTGNMIGGQQVAPGVNPLDINNYQAAPVAPAPNNFNAEPVPNINPQSIAPNDGVGVPSTGGSDKEI